MSRDERDDELDDDREEDDRELDLEADEPEEEEEPRPRKRRRPRRERGVVLFADRGGSIIRTGDDALDEDMPVLNAFRQFLDQERKRAKRQMMGVIALFSILLLAVLGAGGWYVRTVLQRMEQGIESDKVKLAENRLAADSNLQVVAKAAISLKKDVIDSKQASVVLQERVKEQSGELNKLLETITTLEVENSLLQRSMRMLGEERSRAPYRRDPDADIFPEARPDVSSADRARSAAPVEPEPMAPAMTASRREAAAPQAGERPASGQDVTLGGIPIKLSLPKE